MPKSSPSTRRPRPLRKARSLAGSAQPSQTHSRQSVEPLRMAQDQDSSGPVPSLRPAHGSSPEATRSDSCGSQLTRRWPGMSLLMA